MKATISLAVIGLALQMFGAETTSPFISVTGTALTEVAPDLMHWKLEVKNTGSELPKVAQLHTDRVTAVLELLKTQAVESKDTQTAQMQFGKNRVYRKGDWVEEGYFASTAVSFKVTELEKYKSLWLTLAGQAGVSVENVTFDSSKRIEVKKETRKKALLVAREKAVDMAATLDGKAGEPLSITEDLSAPGYGNLALNGNNSISNVIQAAADPDADHSAVAPGSIPITVRVVVAFKLLPAQ